VIDSGLCQNCIYNKVIKTKTSTFYLCEKSKENSSFKKYPRLPVLECKGFIKKE
jgi:hypothetical protein